MLISYNWLRELVPVESDARTLAERLTMVGLTVDTVHEAGEDFVIEIDLTSNRPDCLSHLGVAREVATMERRGEVARVPLKESFARVGSTSEFASVEVQVAELCPRYAARIVRGVRVAPSPAWLADRLTRIGSRPINNVTDITNYVLHETGQPLHAFDLARLTGSRIVVRRARAGERLRTLDEADRELSPEMLVIADAERAAAIAGVMGGLDSSITESTQDVLIESACFDRASVRRTARALNLHTDASHRFERGTDPEGVLRAQKRAVELICEIAGGTATEDAIDVYAREVARGAATLRYERVAKVLGIQVAPEEAHGILTALGFTANGDEDDAPPEEVNTYSFTIWTDNRESPTTSERVAGSHAGARRYVAPSWRVDIEREEDLIEEVARHTGYDRIPAELPPGGAGGAYLPGEDRRRALRRTLAGAGFSEAINFSFVSPAHDEQFELLSADKDSSDGAGFVTLPNPVIEDLTRMRLSLLPGLLAAARLNRDHGTRDVRLFEIGNLFRAAGGERPAETEALALVATGAAREADRAGNRRETDFYDLKGALEAAFDRMKIAGFAFTPDDSIRHLRRGQAARVLLGDEVIGTAGRLADEIAASYKLRQPVYVAELRLDRLLSAEEVRSRYRPLARFPAITRDVTVIVDRRRTLDELRRGVAELEQPLLRDVLFVDAYEGEPVPAGKRSVTLRFEYRTDERTLRDEEADAAHAAVVERLNLAG